MGSKTIMKTETIKSNDSVDRKTIILNDKNYPGWKAIQLNMIGKDREKILEAGYTPFKNIYAEPVPPRSLRALLGDKRES
ncbi:hypothetical protein BCR33DRAFT_730963 [Rhizoclosmatium globosum]|uniref:Uncharacterized protein n=1 Tax=Rhizoclosmatium globosum TaxID=329046 RepID=A0A1Y2A5W7_9FUNG|nr:hypothetical protein BCR33DRAFT_730963 [Rhizoclosmatium globosum]|eukprot:ORY17904.1 hypothetical protein BCR33DRAFT_730963 [Rhizoclosmatium globosum]